jgi:hypothetical protein
MLAHMFSDKTDMLIEEVKSRLKENSYDNIKSKPFNRKKFILSKIGENSIINLVKQDINNYIQAEDTSLYLKERNNLDKQFEYQDYSEEELNLIMPAIIRRKKREFQKVLDN